MKRQMVRSLLIATVMASAASAQSVPPQAEIGESNHSDRSVVGSLETSRDSRMVAPSRPSDGTRFRDLRANIEVAPLNSMTVPNIIKKIDAVQNMWEFASFFSWNSDVQTFYSDSTRMIELLDSLKVRFSTATTTNSKNTDKLVEVIRAGFYNGWSHPEVSYLNSSKPFIRRLGAVATAAVQNPEFGLTTLEQARTVNALGAMMNAGYTSPEAAAGSAKIFNQYRTNLTKMNTNRAYGDAIYALGSGLAYSIEGVEMYKLRWVSYPGNPLFYTYSAFYKKIDDLYTELELGSMTKEILDTQEWLANNYSYWLGTLGLAVERPRPQKALEKVISTYGKWPQVSLTAIQQLDYNYNGKYSDGTPIDMNAIKNEVKQKYLPKTYRFDDGKIIFQTGDKVSYDKIKKLVWAMHEVRSQFYRYAGRNTPLELGNQDDSLIAIVYNSPEEYKMNSFLNGMSTANGGLYIEQYGTFYTYERTPQESIYTLEDLFRHEFVHYLQGRFLTPGQWDNAKQEKYHLIWWDEGGAEYTAGSTRDNGIALRKAMATNINLSEGYTIDKTIRSTYADGFTFYTYSFVLFSYLHMYEPQKLLNLVSLVQANKLTEFADACKAMAKDPALETKYQAWMKKLKSDASTFKDPTTSDSYLETYKPIPAAEIRTDLEKIAGGKLSDPVIMTDKEFAPFTVTGRIVLQAGSSPEIRWSKTDSAVTAMITSLKGKTWAGYKTVSAYFTNRTADSCTITFYGNSGSGSVSLNGSTLKKAPMSLVYNGNSLMLTVPEAGNYQLRMYGLTGRILVDRSMNLSAGTSSIALDNQAAGMSIISIVGANHTISSRFIIQ